MPSFTLRKLKPKKNNPVHDTESVSASSDDDDNAKCLERDPLSMPSLLDDDEEGTSTRGAAADTGKDGGNDLNSSECTEATSTETRDSTSLVEVESIPLALEVGRSAHDWLEECFNQHEVSVLDRQKFDAIPEVIKSDFNIKRHLGKGSYSDVFEVVDKRKQLELMTTTAGPKSKLNIPNRKHYLKSRRRATTALSASIPLATLSRPTTNLRSDSPHTYALKCLRPQIRADPEEFTIGAEDLVHEAAILVNLEHPNIIKLHGRASGCLTNAFVLDDSFFILLDRLDETLKDRIKGWKRKSKLALGPSANQIEVASNIANAMLYLHSKNVIFRDLKPANVGFESMGVLKLFDFGFAIGLPEKDEMNPDGLLEDRCGSPRYMAPEVWLSHGYALPADVYSFGMLLWEVCSLEAPFSHIKSADIFERKVFVEGGRPVIDSRWPTALRELISSCWCDSPQKRPSMLDVKLQLSREIFDMADDCSTLEASTRSTRMAKMMSKGRRMNSSLFE